MQKMGLRREVRYLYEVGTVDILTDAGFLAAVSGQTDAHHEEIKAAKIARGCASRRGGVRRFAQMEAGWVAYCAEYGFKALI